MPETVHVELNGELTAADLDEAIRTLAEARAGMQPPVPHRLPGPESKAEVLLQERTSFKVATLIGGGLRIWLRSDGLGWQAFNISAEDAAGLREFLSKPPGHTYTTH